MTRNLQTVHKFNHFTMETEQQCVHTNLQKHYQQNVHATWITEGRKLKNFVCSHELSLCDSCVCSNKIQSSVCAHRYLNPQSWMNDWQFYVRIGDLEYCDMLSIHHCEWQILGELLWVLLEEGWQHLSTQLFPCSQLKGLCSYQRYRKPRSIEGDFYRSCQKPNRSVWCASTMVFRFIWETWFINFNCDSWSSKLN